MLSWLCCVLGCVVFSVSLVTTQTLDNGETGHYACGELLKAGHGFFMSPDYPGLYPPEVDCTWQITAPLGRRVHLTSEHLSLEHQPECLWDYLDIQDGEHGEHGRVFYCGDDHLDFVSTSNVVNVHFHTDISGSSTGFLIRYDAILPEGAKDGDCNATLTYEGMIMSPGYPGDYPPDHVCYYSIRAPPNMRVRLYFVSFDVETSPCDFDRLLVYSGQSMDAGKLLGVFCGKKLPANLTSESNVLTMQFISDGSIQHTGFIVRAIFVPNNASLIPEAIAPSSPPPPSSSSSSSSSSSTSSMSTPPPTTMTTTSMTFNGGDVSEDSVTTSHPERKLSNTSREQQGCNVTLTGQVVNVTSPGFPRHYPHDATCVTRLRAGVTSSFLLKFANFSLEEDASVGDNCSYDSLSIYTVDSPGSQPNLTLVRRLCGSDLGDPIMSFEGYGLDLVFSSDMSVSDLGFSVQVLAAPLVEGGRCPADCQNGGTCVEVLLADGSVDWRCVCSEQYTGTLCDQVVRDTCDVIHCHNGGQCRDDGVVTSCLCPVGYTGPLCEQAQPPAEGGSLYFTKMAANMSVSVGSSVILECAVNDPTAHVMWLFQDRIMTNTDWSRGVQIHPGGVVVIPEVKDEHSGRYTCMAVTSGDLAERSMWIELTEPCSLYVSKAPNNITVREGQTAMFQCYIPDADVTLWRKDGNVIEPGPRKRILVNHYLVIHSVMETDAGQYTCAARAASGCFARVSAFLRVEPTGHGRECGRPRVRRKEGGSGRISSGEEAVPGTAPWHVIIREDREDTTFCGGSLLSRDTVLTAAHCVAQFEATFTYPFHPRHIQIYLGTHHCAGHNGTYRQLRSYTLHPRFNDTHYNNDLAIFKLDRPVDFSDHIMPICLERPELVQELVKPGRLGLITGCGGRYSHGSVPTFLHEVQIPYVAREICQERAVSVHTDFTPGMFCAGYARSMRGDACAGDSGGPFVVELSGRSIQVGVVSWGVGCDREDHYGYYTNLAHYYDWIMDKIDDHR